MLLQLLVLLSTPLTLGRWHGGDASQRTAGTLSAAQLLARMDAASLALTRMERDPTPVPTPVPPTLAPPMSVSARLEYFLKTGHWPVKSADRPASAARKAPQVASSVAKALTVLTAHQPKPQIVLRGQRVTRTFALPGRQWIDPGATCSAHSVAGLATRRGKTFTTGDIPDLAVAGVYKVLYGCLVGGRAASPVQRTVVVMRMPQPHIIPTPAPALRVTVVRCKHGRTVGRWSGCNTMCGPGLQFRHTLVLHCDLPVSQIDGSLHRHQSKATHKVDQRRCERSPCRNGMVDPPRKVPVPELGGAGTHKIDQWQDDDAEPSEVGLKEHFGHGFGMVPPTTATRAPTQRHHVYLDTNQYLLTLARADEAADARRQRQAPTSTLDAKHGFGQNHT